MGGVRLLWRDELSVQSCRGRAWYAQCISQTDTPFASQGCEFIRGASEQQRRAAEEGSAVLARRARVRRSVVPLRKLLDQMCG